DFRRQNLDHPLQHFSKWKVFQRAERYHDPLQPGGLDGDVRFERIKHAARIRPASASPVPVLRISMQTRYVREHAPGDRRTIDPCSALDEVAARTGSASPGKHRNRQRRPGTYGMAE